MLLPVVGQARASARMVVCLGNQHQLGISMGQYQSDYNWVIPMSQSYEWFGAGYPNPGPVSGPIFGANYLMWQWTNFYDGTVTDNPSSGNLWGVGYSGLPWTGTVYFPTPNYGQNARLNWPMGSKVCICPNNTLRTIGSYAMMWPNDNTANTVDNISNVLVPWSAPGATSPNVSNYNFMGINVPKIPSPNNYVLLADSVNNVVNTNSENAAGAYFTRTYAYDTHRLWLAHFEKANVLFADGHALTSDTDTLKSTSNGNINRGSGIAKTGFNAWADGSFNSVSVP